MEPTEPVPSSHYPFTRIKDSIIIPRGTETSVDVLEIMKFMRDKLDKEYKDQWQSSLDEEKNAYILTSSSNQILNAAEKALQKFHDKHQQPPKNLLK